MAERIERAGIDGGNQVHDPEHVILRRALRVALVLPLLFVFVYDVLGLVNGAPYAAFGSFALLAFADFGGPTRDRFLAYLAAGGAGLIAIVLGTLAAYSTTVAIISTFIVGFVLTFSGVLRGYVATATLPVLLPFVIAVTAGSGELSQLPERMAGFAIAVGVSAVAAVVLWPSHLRSSLRSQVAQTLTASANLIRATWSDPDQPTSSAVDVQTRIRELNEAHHKLREQYDGRPLRPGGATARDRALMQLVDELSRLRLFLKWRAHPEILEFPPNAHLASTTAATLAQCADAINGDAESPDPNVVSLAREEHRNAAEAYAEKQLKEHHVLAVKETVDTGFQLRIGALFSEIIARNTRIATGSKPDHQTVTTAGVPLDIPEPTPGKILRSNLSLRSPWLRNSLRAGLALAIAVAVVSFTQVDHGFWVVLGTIAALRLDVVGTTVTALRAILGTAIGFAIGTGILLLLGGHPVALWMLFPIAVFLSAFTPAAIGVVVGQASFTIFVIVMYSIILGPSFETGRDRVVDVGMGLVISLFVSLLMWPRGVAAKMRETLSESMSASTEYLVAAYARLVEKPTDDAEFEALHARAAKAGTAVYETFDLTLSQSRSDPAQIAAWSFMVNATGHIMTSADLITWMSRSGRTPRGFDMYGERLMESVRFIRGRIEQSVTELGTAFDTGRASATMADDALMSDSTGEFTAIPGDPFDALNECVSQCLLALQNDPDPDHRAGTNAISIIWAQDWLIHLNWVADQVSLVTRRATAAAAPATTEPATSSSD